MKKLNQNGWGLSVFLAFIVVFLIAIILISIGAERVGITENGNTKTPSSNDSQDSIRYTKEEISQAEQYEIMLREETSRYLSDINQDFSGVSSKIIPISELIQKNYLQSLMIAGNICTGYSIIQIQEGVPLIQAFVHCGKVYTTEGYDISLES